MRPPLRPGRAINRPTTAPRHRARHGGVTASPLPDAGIALGRNRSGRGRVQGIVPRALRWCGVRSAAEAWRGAGVQPNITARAPPPSPPDSRPKLFERKDGPGRAASRLSVCATRSLARVPLRRCLRRADAYGFDTTRRAPPSARAIAPPGGLRGAASAATALGAPGFSQIFRPARPPPLPRLQRLDRGPAKAAPRRRPWRRPASPAAPGPSRPPRAGTRLSASFG